jgi:hypothetical protein
MRLKPQILLNYFQGRKKFGTVLANSYKILAN